MKIHSLLYRLGCCGALLLLSAGCGANAPDSAPIAERDVAPVAEPNVAEPNVAEPEVAEPEVAEPEVAQLAKPNETPVPHANAPVANSTEKASTERASYRDLTVCVAGMNKRLKIL